MNSGVTTYATGRLIDWLDRDEGGTAGVVRELLSGMAPGDTDLMETVVRAGVLKEVSPLPHQPGPAMELHVFLLETALRVIDWGRVVEHLRRTRWRKPRLIGTD